MTRKNILTTVVMTLLMIMSILILYIQSSDAAVELERCKECHGTVKPISIITKDCNVCHDTHGGVIEPGTRDPVVVHDKHEDAGRRVRQKSCQKCHRSPVECTKCHNSHENLESIIISKLQNQSKNVLGKNISNTSNQSKNVSTKVSTNVSAPLCTDCHGNLPQPKGHEDFRNALSKSKHKWMNCRTCHVNKDYNMELGFKNLIAVKIDDSIRICKICHSSQYEKLKEGNHGTPDQKCVNCHNPHTTQLSGPKFKVTPVETPANISTRVGSTKEWLTNKIPLLKNTTAMFILLIVVLVVVLEYVLSKEEEGKKTAYNMVKINAGEDTLKTLEVRLENKNVGAINDLLEESGINILGMTMQKEKSEDKLFELYKYVIFIDVGRIIDETDEKNLIDRILSIRDVKTAEFTDKYEL